MTSASRERKQCLVLLVEDNHATYELYSEILASAGYAVVGAESGQDAYAAVFAHRPDLIVMDNEQHGAALTERLKHEPATRRIPVVLLSGSVGVAELERARGSGCDAFLLKPCPLNRLLDEVKRWMPRPRIGGKILIIEDDRDICEALTDLLQAHGLHVDCVHDGRQGIDFLQRASEPPRLILLDLMLPVMDGWSFRAAQLAEPRLAAIPVVVLSATSSQTERSLELHADEFLDKPVDAPRLWQAIERHL